MATLVSKTDGDWPGASNSAMSFSGIAVQAGDLIIASTTWEEASHTVTVTDNASGGSNVYTNRVTQNCGGGGSPYSTNVNVATAIAKASETLTITHTLDSQLGNNGWGSAFVHIFRPASGRVFVYNNAASAGYGDNTVQNRDVTTGSFNVIATGGAALCVMRPDNWGTYTLGSGWTDGTTTTPSAKAEYLLLTNSTSITGNFDFDGTVRWVVGAVSFLEGPKVIQSKFWERDSVGSATLSQNLDTACGAGNTLVLFGWSAFSNARSVQSVSQGSGARSGTVLIQSTTAINVAVIPDCTASSEVTFTLSGINDYARLWAVEVAGAYTSAPNDVAKSSGTEQNFTTATDAMTTGSFSTTQFGDLIVALGWDGNSGTYIPITGTGFTSIASGSSGTNDGYRLEYKHAGAAGSYAATFTQPTAAADYSAHSLALKLLSGSSFQAAWARNANTMIQTRL